MANDGLNSKNESINSLAKVALEDLIDIESNEKDSVEALLNLIN